jgi:hypothetical protein
MLVPTAGFQSPRERGEHPLINLFTSPVGIYPHREYRVGLFSLEMEMSSFRVLVGDFAIVGTTGPAGGRQPAMKSDAVAYDVIDRTSDANTQYACRDQTFDAAWDFCTRRIAIVAAGRPH